MKRWFTLSLLTLFALILTSTTGLAQFKAGNHYIGANATVLVDPVGWGLGYEYGYDENLGLGVLVRYFGQEDINTGDQTYKATLGRETYMAQAQALYHAFPKAQFDPYGGLRLGYSYYNEKWEVTEGVVDRAAPVEKAASGITLSLAVGMRYFFSPQLSLDAALEYFLYNDEDYFKEPANTGMVIGVNFTLM